MLTPYLSRWQDKAVFIIGVLFLTACIAYFIWDCHGLSWLRAGHPIVTLPSR